VQVDIAVIGRGLLGSAAARHLAELSTPDVTVAVIGPGEPDDRTTHEGAFGAHYDSGRITRTIDRNPFFARLSAASIARHRDLERATGIDFFQQVGHLAVSPMAEYLGGLQARANEHNIDVDRLSADDLASRFRSLAFAPDNTGLFDPTGGWIDPRALITAQNEAVLRASGHVIDATVTDLVAGPAEVRLTTACDQQVLASRVLIATGGFANHFGVIPKEIDFEIHEHTVVLAEVEGESRAALIGMPSVIYKRGDVVGESVYVLPPIAYPDGRTWVKIGQSTGRPMIDPASSLIPWFQSDGDPAISSWLSTELVALMPNTRFSAMTSQSCVTTKSATGRPFIDRFSDTPIYSLLAGNGQVAKSADELGWIAAHRLLEGEIPDAYRNEDFALRLG